MTLFIQSISDRGRPPVAGNGRLYKVRDDGKGTEIIGQFLLTAPTAEALAVLGEHVGNPVDPWVPGPKDAESPDQFCLLAGTSLDVVMFGDPSEVVEESYTLWSGGRGGQMARRCDGSESVTACTVPGQEGGLDHCPCICRAEQQVSCKPKARLWVSLFHANTTIPWRFSSGEAGTVGSLGIAVRHAFLMSDRPGVAAGRLHYETATTRFRDPRTGKERNGIKAYPKLEPLSMNGDANVGAMLTAAEERASAAALLASGDGWGDAPALSAGPSVGSVTQIPSAAPAKVDNPPPSLVSRLRKAAITWQRQEQANPPWTYLGYSKPEDLSEGQVGLLIEQLENGLFAAHKKEEG